MRRSIIGKKFAREIDLIYGGESLRHWADDPAATAADLEVLAGPDERAWLQEREAYLLYR